MGKRWRATALQDAGALTDDHRTARSVLECASPLALWAGALPSKVPLVAVRKHRPMAVWGGRTGQRAVECLDMSRVAPHFFDASAAVKLVLNEDGCEKVRNYFATKHGGYWMTDVCLVEALSVLKRNKKKLGQSSYLGRCFMLISYIRHGRIGIVETQLQKVSIWNETEKFSKKYYKLDVSDALQIVTLQTHFTKSFSEDSETILITADYEFAKAARNEGLRVWDCIKEDAPQQ
jgi:predicted nucleic acid-binding protein